MLYRPQLLPIALRGPFLLCTAAFLFCAAVAAADTHRFELDAAATAVVFDLPATGHDIHGALYLTEGTLELDPATGTASGELHIDATRAESGNKKRDKKMRNAVLLSDENPMIVFKAESLRGEGLESGGLNGEIEIDGTVTIAGGEHPMTLPVVLEVDGDRFKASAKFIVPYVEWGMEDPSILFLKVAQEVEVTVDAVGTWSAPAATASAGE